MIANKDRSGYIGASDTSYVMRPWNTKTFERWWRIKQGIEVSNLQTEAMMAGTAYEHRILEALHIPGMEMDRQIIKGRLRVNLDGSTPSCIYEVKTHKAGKEFKVTADYRRQANVEMFADNVRQLNIVAYALEEEDYKNFYREIDQERISWHPVQYDKEFIMRYLPRMLYLSYCMDVGKFPVEEEVDAFYRSISGCGNGLEDQTVHDNIFSR